MPERPACRDGVDITFLGTSVGFLLHLDVTILITDAVIEVFDSELDI